MIKYIVDENALPSGAYQLHNTTRGCTEILNLKNQIFIGNFADCELALKRARMNWPREKVIPCPKCCTEE